MEMRNLLNEANQMFEENIEYNKLLSNIVLGTADIDYDIFLNKFGVSREEADIDIENWANKADDTIGKDDTKTDNYRVSQIKKVIDSAMRDPAYNPKILIGHMDARTNNLDVTVQELKSIMAILTEK